MAQRKQRAATVRLTPNELWEVVWAIGVGIAKEEERIRTLIASGKRDSVKARMVRTAEESVCRLEEVRRKLTEARLRKRKPVVHV